MQGLTLTLTLKDAWRSIPGVFDKTVRMVTDSGAIVGKYIAVPGTGVDFKGDREYHPCEVVRQLAFKNSNSPLQLF